jgi:hypothetical protein
MRSAAISSIIRLQPPDCDNDAGVDRIACRDGVQQRPVFGEDLAAAIDPLLRDAPVPVLLPGLGEFGLPAVQLQYFVIRANGPQSLLQRGLRHAATARLGRGAIQEFLETDSGGTGRAASQKRGGTDSGDQTAAVQHARSNATLGRAATTLTIRLKQCRNIRTGTIR